MVTEGVGRNDSPSGAAMIRAALALLFAVSAPALVLLYREAIFSALTAAFGIVDQSDSTVDGWFRISIYGTIGVLALLGLLLFRARPRGGSGGARLPVIAFAAGAGAVALLLGIACLSGVAAPAATPWPRITPWLFTTGTLLVLLQVCAEELLFRGLLQPLLVRVLGGLPGVALAALGFAAVHFAGGWRNPVSLANIFLAGCWFGVLAQRTGGLFAPVAAHLGYNWTEEMLFGASPNPGRGAFGSIFDLDLSGPGIWGGSGEGLNASLVLSVVLLLLVLASLGRFGGTDAAKREAVAPT